MIKCADLGGSLVCNDCMKSSTDSDNAAEQKFGTWSHWDLNGKARLVGSMWLFSSARLCSAGLQTSINMSTIKGMRIVLSCGNHLGAFILNGLEYYDAVLATAKEYAENAIAAVHIVDPTFYMNMVQVDPTIDKQPIASEQRRSDLNSFLVLQHFPDRHTYQTC